MKLCGSLIAIGTLIGMIFGYFFWMESRYALAQQLKEVEQRLDYKIKSDQYKAIQSRIWVLQDRCQKICDLSSKEELRSLQADLDDSKGQLKVMEKN